MKIRKNEGESQPFISVRVSNLVMLLFCSGFFIEKFSSKGQQKIGISCFSPLGCKCSLLTALYLLNSIVGFKVLFQLYSFFFCFANPILLPASGQNFALNLFLTLLALYNKYVHLNNNKNHHFFLSSPKCTFSFFSGGGQTERERKKIHNK